jgi:hypothetical protein
MQISSGYVWQHARPRTGLELIHRLVRPQSFLQITQPAVLDVTKTVTVLSCPREGDQFAWLGDMSQSKSKNCSIYVQQLYQSNTGYSSQLVHI